jgi:hypothetical protein
MKRVTILLLIALLSSCKKEHSAGIAPSAPAPEPVATKANAEQGRLQSVTDVGSDAIPGGVAGSAPATGPAADGVPAPTVQKLPRLIIRTAEVRVIVADAAAAARALVAAAEAAGGYVGDAKTWREGEQLRGTLTLRIPAERLSALLSATRKLALRVESENVTSEDVSQEYVDLASQLKNQEAAEVELRALMTDVRQKVKRASDVIELYQQLTAIHGEVEKTKGRMQFLGQMAAMSTVKVELIPDVLAKPVVTPGWQPVGVVKDAGRALVAALQAIVTALIWFVIYVLPVMLLFVIPVWLFVRLVRSLRRRKMPPS